MLQEHVLIEFYLINLTQINPASFLIYSFLIKLPSLFLLQLLMKYGGEFAERPPLFWTILYLRAINDLRLFDDFETLNIIGTLI